MRFATLPSCTTQHQIERGLQEFSTRARKGSVLTERGESSCSGSISKPPASTRCLFTQHSCVPTLGLLSAYGLAWALSCAAAWNGSFSTYIFRWRQAWWRKKGTDNCRPWDRDNTPALAAISMLEAATYIQPTARPLTSIALSVTAAGAGSLIDVRNAQQMDAWRSCGVCVC